MKVWKSSVLPILSLRSNQLAVKRIQGKKVPDAYSKSVSEHDQREQKPMFYNTKMTLYYKTEQALMCYRTAVKS